MVLVPDRGPAATDRLGPNNVGFALPAHPADRGAGTHPKLRRGLEARPASLKRRNHSFKKIKRISSDPRIGVFIPTNSLNQNQTDL